LAPVPFPSMVAMPSRLERYYIILMTALSWLTNLLLVLLLTVVAAAVGVRYFGLFEGSLHWADELSRFTMIWIAMLGSVLAFDRSAHLAISFLPQSVPAVAQRVIVGIADLLSALFVGVLAWQGFVLASRTMDQFSPALFLPTGWVYMAIAVGATLMTLQSLLFALFPALRRTRKDEEDRGVGTSGRIRSS